jgi:DNA-binding transcriptional LysR family regulator
MNADRGWVSLEILDCIVRRGTLSAAARELGLDQTTVSRRLAALERALGSQLFSRVDGRLVPTTVLEPVLERLKMLADEAETTMAILRRNGEDLQEHVRITSVGFMLRRAIAPGLGTFVREHPGIRLDMIDDDNVLSFEKYDVDVALRLGRRAEASTQVRSLGTFRYVLCRPAGLDSTGSVPIVHFGERLAHLPEMATLRRIRPTSRTAFVGNRLDLLVEASLHFGAEVMLPEPVVRRDPRFVIVPGDHEFAVRSCFLMIHPQRKRVRSVLAVARWMEACFYRWRDEESPMPPAG